MRLRLTNKYSLLILAVLVAVCLAINWPWQASIPPAEEKDLLVRVFYIGQGDSILIKSGKDAVLVDSGVPPEKDNLVRYLKEAGVRELALLVATHPHGDHIGGAAEILAKFPVKEVLYNGQLSNSAMLRHIMQTVKDKNIPFTVVKQGYRYKLDKGAYLEVLWPGEKLITDTGSSNSNNNSMVLKLVKDDFSMLLAADIEKAAENILVTTQKDNLKSNVLKAPHHASESSSTAGFVEAVGAKDVVVSCGINNDWGFPNYKVVERYKKAGMSIYVTAADGAVTIRSDGKNYQITKEK